MSGLRGMSELKTTILKIVVIFFSIWLIYNKKLLYINKKLSQPSHLSLIFFNQQVIINKYIE